MSELDKVSEKILKQIIKYDNSLKANDFQKIKETRKYSIRELSDCLCLLEDLNYISLDIKNNILNITFKGKQYFLLKRKSIYMKIVFSLIIPLLISFTTAYFTAKFTTPNEVIVHINTIHNV